MPPKKIPTVEPPGDEAVIQPKLTVSLFGLFKVDGHGTLGVRAAYIIALSLCGLAIAKMALTLFSR